MPNIKSAKKRVKIAEAKNLRNRMFKSQLKTLIKKLTLHARPETRLLLQLHTRLP